MAKVQDVPSDAQAVKPEPELKVYSAQRGYKIQFGSECLEFVPIVKQRRLGGVDRAREIGGYFVAKGKAQVDFFNRIVPLDSNLSFSEIPQDED